MKNEEEEIYLGEIDVKEKRFLGVGNLNSVLLRAFICNGSSSSYGRHCNSLSVKR